MKSTKHLKLLQLLLERNTLKKELDAKLAQVFKLKNEQARLKTEMQALEAMGSRGRDAARKAGSLYW